MAEALRRRVRAQAAADRALRARPAVRAAIALDRRAGPALDRLATRGRALAEMADRVRLAVAAARVRPGGDPLGRAAAAIARLPAVADPPPGRVAIVRLGGPADGDRDVPAPVPVVARDALGEVDAALLCLVAAGVAPLHPSWLARLAGALGGDVVAAAPLLLHPRRPRSAATPHDGRVRSYGLDVVVAPDGGPALRAHAAGEPPDVARPPRRAPVALGCLAVARDAFDAAGGLRSLGDPDLDLADLGLRLAAHGGLVVVPAAAMVDQRPVRRRAALVAPFPDDSRGRRELVARHGAALMRRAAPARAGELRLALTCSAPSAKVARRWGDWHLAEALGRALRRRGHGVRVQTADLADSPAGRGCDVHVVVRGLEPARATPGQAHVLWVISHPELVSDAECDEADLVLVASERFAAELRERTRTPVEVMLQATDPERFRPVARDAAHAHDVTVVAKTRDVLRPVVADALAAGIRPAIYGSGWDRFVDRSLVVADHVPNELLPAVYSSAGVVLNDHWDTMREWGFVSNRLFDVLACGAPVVSDDVPGIDDVFGDTVPRYRDPAELRALVAADLDAPERARARAARGRAIVLGAHTFDHRAAQLLDALARHGLAGTP
ncbi:MAG: hypothetical protein KatS3mg009_1808 [Acidimicrobiia bacterium]|nr:MAG: hypothetical protein KatS3mg009_1808 [Acidimicrobiia bacterium]